MQKILQNLSRLVRRIPFWLGLLAVLALIYDYGFDQSLRVEDYLYRIYLATLIIGITSLTGRYFFSKRRPPRLKIWLIDSLLLLFLLALLLTLLNGEQLSFIGRREWLFIALFLVVFREFSALDIELKRQYLNPAQLFILSFITLIIVGTLLLMLPNATHTGISLLDAFFTSTSAVCVTGLIVVDTGSFFTLFGQTIILLLIQVGGLGIMTFTSYFSYFFRGRSSYETQLLLRDITNAEKIADVFGTLKKIILLTFIIEAAGAVLIFFSLDSTLIPSLSERTFFSLFHTVSGFCNAGFSTLPNSLYETAFRFNYPLHLVLAGLFIIGGIGFPIIFNFFKYIKYMIVSRLLQVTNEEPDIHSSWLININTRIVVITTTLLILVGTVLFYVFEYHNTLAEHHGAGKIITAFFGAVTPRTAGFNSVDTSALHFSTLMFIFLLMWIGASSGSTGGGIKTSTFAIGTLNYLSIARGKNRIEVFGREISDVSVHRAFAIISLSLVVVGLSIFLVASFDQEKSLLEIAFECFSAYSTVGLSLGITAGLSSASKAVIIGTMFIGRVGMLTILIAFLRKVHSQQYKYPTEEILIT